MKPAQLWARRGRIRFFSPYISSGNNVLEVGSGEGWFRETILQKRVASCVTCDLFPPADVVGDIRNWRELGLPGESFDVIVAFEVVEHVDCFRACRDLLRPGGALLVTTPLPCGDWILRITESLRLNQKRTSPHSNLTWLKRVDGFMVEKIRYPCCWHNGRSCGRFHSPASPPDRQEAVNFHMVQPMKTWCNSSGFFFRCMVSAFLVVPMISPAFAQSPLRVACVGDSITYGDKLADRDVQSYPAVLERLSGGRFAVGNFGVNGATALRGTGRAWTDTEACRDALDFSPDFVVVMLGINDLAFPDRFADYPADLSEIVARFRSLPSAPRVFLCTLTPLAPADRQAHANRTVRETMIPDIRAAAAETGAAIIDVAAAFPPRIDLLPDGLHPSPEGAELIARAVLAGIDATGTPAPQIQPAPVPGPVARSIRNEALAAKNRAERWLVNQPPRTLRDPAAQWKDRELRSPDAVAPLLPLLAGEIPRSLQDPFYSFAALAAALDRIGNETVFLPDGQPVAWREALLHQLVQLQRIDPDGGGYWIPPERKSNAAMAVESTAYALQALAIALGP